MKPLIRQLALLTAIAFLACPPVGRASTEVIYITPDGEVPAENPLKAALEAQECRITETNWRDLPSLDQVDILVLGGSHVRDVEFRAAVFARLPALNKFLEQGGILLDLAISAPKDYWPHYLPLQNKLEFTADESAELVILHPEHSIGQAVRESMIPMDGERIFKSPARIASGAIHKQRGFSVIAASDPLGMYGLLVEASAGRGRTYICTMPVDAPLPLEGEPAREVMERITKGVALGLVAASESIRTARMPVFRPDPAADLQMSLSWRIIVLPDTQCYLDENKAASNERHFHRQTQWIVENKLRGDIRYVLHTGDMTQHNTPLEWAKARKIMSELNGHVPYLVIPGNHDIGPGGNAYDRTTLMAGYFPISDAKKYTGFAGAFKEDDPSNVYHLLKAGGVNWLIIGLEFGPRDEVLRWARKLIEAHPRHAVILVTHAYLYDDNTRYDYKNKGNNQAGNPQYYHIMAEPGFANDGEQMWKSIVSKTRTASVVICGHVLGDGLGYLEESNIAGEKVAQMLVNFQQRKEGGEGYLRILEFSKDSRTIRVMDYSPSLDRFLPGYQSQFLVHLR
jgi:predicted phosphodiesterase